MDAPTETRQAQQKQIEQNRRESERPVIRPNMVSAFRALRVLEILQNETDDTCAITANELAQRLREPNVPGLPSVPSDCKAVYTAVTCLRALGYDVRNRGRQGYSLATRVFTHDELAAIIEAVEGAPALSRARAHLCTDKLLTLGTPSFRREFHLLQENSAAAEQQEAAPPRVQYAAQDLVCTAIEQRLELAIEIAPQPQHPGPQTAAAATRTQYEALNCRVVPTELTEREGVLYLRGLAMGERGSAPAARTFRLERLTAISAQLPTGELAVAVRNETDAAA